MSDEPPDDPPRDHDPTNPSAEDLDPDPEDSFVTATRNESDSSGDAEVPDEFENVKNLDLSEYTTDPADEDPNANVSDAVLEAMEPGKEAGTIREIDDPNDPLGLDTDDDDDDGDVADAGDDVGESSENHQSDPTTGTSGTGHARSQSAPQQVSSPDDLDFEGLADDDDEWTWGQKKETSEFTYKGMRVVMSEPSDDEVLNMLRRSQRIETDADGDVSLPDDEQEEGDEMQQLKLYAQLAIDSPEITDERWANGMTATERLTVGSMAAKYIDGGNFTDASGSGQPAQPGSSPR